jgi:hypothetical protein
MGKTGDESAELFRKVGFCKADTLVSRPRVRDLGSSLQGISLHTVNLPAISRGFHSLTRGRSILQSSIDDPSKLSPGISPIEPQPK